MGIKLGVFGLREPQPAPNPVEIARRLVKGRSREEMLVMAGAMTARDARSSLKASAPQTPDELWDFIKDTYKIEIARVAVCDDHDAPFDFVCAGFFEWFPNIFEIGPRGGGKSFKTSLIIHLNSRFHEGCESVVFGAVDEQSKKVYEDFKNHFLNKGLPDGEIENAGEPKMTETLLKCGSKVTCFPATVAKVNGPHPPKVHSEEVELMKPAPWKESRNLAADKILDDGTRIMAQNYGTSTRKWRKGRVDKIYQAFLEARQKAREKFGADKARVDDLITKTTQFYVFIHCIFEIAQQVPNCRMARENADLPESGTPGFSASQCKCDCNLIESGKWDDQTIRSLDQICQGRFYKSRGHRSRGEVIQLFIQNDRWTWAAQQECRESESEGLYVKAFSPTRHGLSSFVVDPANGPIYNGIDWGFTNQACVLWIQYLDRAVTAVGFNGETRILPARSRVIFAEIYEAGLSATELGQKAATREVQLASRLSISRIPVRKRYADVQGAGDRKDWRKLGMKTSKYSTRSFEEHVKEVRGMFENDRAFVVVDLDPEEVMGCPSYVDEIQGWREHEGKEVEEHNHAMSAGRYGFYGMHDVYNDAGALLPDGTSPAELTKRTTNGNGPGAVAARSQQDPLEGLIEEESWRAALGVSMEQG